MIPYLALNKKNGIIPRAIIDLSRGVFVLAVQTLRIKTKMSAFKKSLLVLKRKNIH